MLVQLIYISVPATGARDSIAKSIAKFRAKNLGCGINTVVLATDDFFLQLIEGKREEVNGLYRTISQDPRHTNVTLVRFQEIRKAEFSDCNMIYLHDDDVCREHIADVCNITRVNCTQINSATAASIIRRAAAVVKSHSYPNRRKTDVPALFWPSGEAMVSF